MKRNRSLIIIKLIFTIGIIIMHWNIPKNKNLNYLRGAYIFVDFFFMVQGFFINIFIENSKNIYENMKNYIKNRLKRFWKCVFIQACCLAFLEFVVYNNSLKSYLKTIIGTVIQLSFISQLLPQNLLNNGTLWFLSASLIAGLICIFIIRILKNEIILLIIAFGIYNYILTVFHNFDIWHTLVFNTFQVGLLRAIAGILFGYIIQKVLYHSKSIISFKKYYIIQKVLYHSKSIILGLLLVTVNIISHTKLDYIYLFIFAILLFSIGIEEKLTENKYLIFLDEILLPMYIFQVISIRVIRIFICPSITSGILVLLLDFLISYIYIVIFNKKDNELKVK